jgi:iron complex transport system ATP-binding protein
MINLEHIEISYRSGLILKAASFKLEHGKIIALIGKNGSGKSSLIKGIAGLNDGFKGEVKVNGKDRSKISSQDLARYLAIVHTDSPFPAMMPLNEFVAFGRYPFNNWLGKLREEDKIAVEHAIEACDLKHLSRQRMENLSDGEKQRAMIARAISQESDFLILDEPSTHLDGQNTLKILKLLRDQAREKGRGVLYSTHRIAESIELADELWIISNRQLKSFTKAEFLEDQQLQNELFGEHLTYEAGGNGNSFRINLS